MQLSFYHTFCVFRYFLFVNTDVLRTDRSGQPTTYGATAATPSSAGGYDLISFDNTEHFVLLCTAVSTLFYSVCCFIVFHRHVHTVVQVPWLTAACPVYFFSICF